MTAIESVPDPLPDAPTWQFHAACRGEDSSLFFAPNYFERREEKNRRDGKAVHPGKVGADVTVEQAQWCARRAALGALAALKAELGSLDRVRRIVNVTVYVASASGFAQQPQVANGASDFLAEVMGDAGR